ncbi:CBS domain-containing protein [Brevibacillus invocatus]|uniref:CBS domain-containing protein n=2 Tax=Brevibacillus invocatus TaxID=173959 RepID=A0A3M8CI18_9BACL|nr:CBS domain-containing protein [Brevibacillus invocatus]
MSYFSYNTDNNVHILSNACIIVRTTPFMTTNFSFLKTHSSFREAVLYFHQSKVGILPVVDEQNQLVGAITRYSVFRALLEDISLDSAVFTHMIREPVTLFEDEVKPRLHS